MDQVDNIIFQNFISLGWEKEDKVTSLKDLEVSTIAALLVKCLTAINSDNDLPQSLPYNMSQRFRAAAKIAETIKDLGYSGDIGYQSILYSSEADLRNIFTFLIEKLPKDSPVFAEEPLSKLQLIKRESSKRMSDALERPWVPPHCAAVARRYKAASNTNEGLLIAQYGISHSRGFVTDSSLNCELNSHFNLDFYIEKDDAESATFKCSSDQLFPTLLNFHSELLGSETSMKFDKEEINNFDERKKRIQSIFKSSVGRLKPNDLFNAFQEKNIIGKLNVESTFLGDMDQVNSELPTSSEEVSAENILKAQEENREKEIITLSQALAQGQEKLLNLTKECKKKEDNLVVLEKVLKEEEEKLSKEEKRMSLIKKTSSLMSDPEANIQKLKETLQASKEKEKKLNQQWLDYKKPLEKELEAAKLKLETKWSKQNEMEREVCEVKKNTESLIEDAKMKEMLIAQLKEQKSKLGKGANRSVYTKQILDISAKVQKQKQEISKILSDTRVIQKEINTLTGKLQRTFAVVEDASFKAANSNERARPIYRAVINIHEEFGALVDITREIGIIEREIADLQQQLNSEKSKDIEDKIKKLQEDLNSLKIENSSLKQKYAMTEISILLCCADIPNLI